MKEIRRRTKVVGAFSDGQSCLNLAAARLRHIAGSKWSTRKYMEYDTVLRGKNINQWSRRMMKCAKDSSHYRFFGAFWLNRLLRRLCSMRSDSLMVRNMGREPSR